jgi:glutamate carboxypeptidase
MPHSDLSALATWCESQSDWIVETAEALGRLESPSTDKAAVDRCGEELAARLGAIGGRVERLRRENAGDHLRAEFGRGDRQVLLLGHFDTVWPVGQIARMPIRREAGRLHGPGIFDMKAGIALGMAAARALIQRGTDPGRRVVMLWTTDEEIGSRTSRGAIEEEARRSEAVFVLEPALPGGAV